MEACWAPLLSLLRADLRGPRPTAAALDKAGRQAIKDKWAALNKLLEPILAQQVRYPAVLHTHSLAAEHAWTADRWWQWVLDVEILSPRLCRHLRALVEWGAIQVRRGRARREAAVQRLRALLGSHHPATNDPNSCSGVAAPKPVGRM